MFLASHIRPKIRRLKCFLHPRWSLRIYTHSFWFSKNAPAVRLMNRQLGDSNFVSAYMDSVFSSSFNEHIDHLLIVFDRLFLSGIKLNWAKCFYFQHRIAILGHIIVHNKIMINPLKIDKIRDMTPPKSIKD
jgi:hypothetical protein